MSGALEGRVVLLTGAGGGIGRAMAKRFVAEGAVLAASDRNTECLEDLGIEPGSRHPADLGASGAPASLIDAVIAEHGRLDVVVANAGWTVHGRFEDMSREEVDVVLRLNLLSVVELVRAALPHLPVGGDVVVTASLAGETAFPLQSTYSAAKHGLVGFSDALRGELHPRGVAVTTLLPGTVATEFLNHAGAHDPTREMLADLMQRFGTSPDRVAAAAVRGIRRRGGRCRVGWDAHLAAVVRWLLPPLLPAILRFAFRHRRVEKS